MAEGEEKVDVPAQEQEEKKQQEPKNGCTKDAAPVPQEISPLESKVIRQVEFYFGDRNLPKDKFLQQAVASDSEGWVPITTLLTFNRLKALSSDKDYILAALRKAGSSVIQVSDDGECVRRHPDHPVPDILSPEKRKQIKERSVYAKGFAEDTKLDELQEFFDQFGKTQYIQMRRTIPERTFKGSVFVEFERKEDAEKFVSLDVVKFKDTELLRETKEQYYKRKQNEKRSKPEQKSEPSKASEEVKSKEEELHRQQFVKVSCCVLHFKGCGQDVSWERLKEVFQEFSTVAFIEFERGDTEGYVRFQEEGGAQRALEGLTKAAGEGGKPQLCGADTELRVLAGDEEVSYWRKVLSSKGKKAVKKDRGRGGRKRRQRASKDEAGQEEAGPVVKQAKEDDGED